VTLSSSRGFLVLTLTSEDEEMGDEDESEAGNPLVDALFEQVEELRVRVRSVTSIPVFYTDFCTVVRV
jgi:hypothetical protein